MIKFGTDGWRAVIGEGFTYENVRRVARAHAKVLKEKGAKKVLIGYDWRFSSERFAKQVYDIFVSEGLEAKLTKRACTTPMVSFGVRYMGFDNGVMITASHNPPEYNGYKIKESFGGSATPEFVKEVESKLGVVSGDPVPSADPQYIDVEELYISKVRERVSFEIFREKELTVVHDAMHGTTSGVLSKVLEGTKVEVVKIRSYRDPLFGGTSPEPVEKNLGALREKVLALSADLGVANDGDGDRVALVDDKGSFVNTQMVFALLLYHLVKNKGKREGIVVKTVSTTYLADRICRSEGIELREVPVGFKNINEVILKEKVLFGGEESGGYGFPEFLPERDGILSALMVLEMVLLMDAPLSEAVTHLTKNYGPSFYRRIDLPVEERSKERLRSLIGDPPTKVGGRVVEKVLTIDGLKFVFGDESWLLLRPSGTEPLIRIYAEAPSEGDVEELLRAGKDLITV